MTNFHTYFPPLITDDIFNQIFRNAPKQQLIPTSGFPVVDQYHDDDGNAIIEFALAGYKSTDLKVSVEGSKLTVSSDGAESLKTGAAVRRIAKRKFLTTFTDHDNVFDLQKLDASFEDGILRVFIPKKEGAKAKVFEIKTRKALTK